MVTFYAPSAYRVSVAFADGPLVVAPTWTDVTAWFRSISTSRGRGSELDDYGPGTATIVLDNRDRRFDPAHAAGPYYGSLLPRRQVKVETVIAGVTRPVFRGLVSSWRQSWAHDDGQVCTIDCVDIASLLAQIPLAGTAHDTLMGFYAPSGWWPLDADTMGEVSGQWPGLYSGRIEADPIGALSGASRVVSTGSASIGSALIASTASTKTSISFLAVNSSPSPPATAISLVSVTGTNGDVHARLSSTGALVASCVAGAQSASVTASSIGGSARHVVVVRDGTTLTVFVDGAAAGSTVNAAMTGTTAPFRVSVGVLDPVTGGDVTLSHVALWQGVALTADQVALLADAALTARLARTASARVDTIAALTGVPVGLRDITTSGTGLGAVNGGDAWSSIQTAARSTPANAYVSRAGLITFQPLIGAAPAATFSDAPGAPGAIRHAGIETEVADRWIRNAITVTAPGGATSTVIDQASINAYGQLALSVTSELSNAAACRGLGILLLDQFAQPTVRGSGWSCTPTDTAELAAICGLELGDIVTVTRTPKVGAPQTSTVQLVSIAHTVTEAGVTVSFGTAPFDFPPLALWDEGLWDSDSWG